jgi:hypothetical protein
VLNLAGVGVLRSVDLAQPLVQPGGLLLTPGGVLGGRAGNRAASMAARSEPNNPGPADQTRLTITWTACLS